MKKETISSQEVITYLKKNLCKKYFTSVFVAGSMPEYLVPQSDLDFFTIMKSETKEKALDNIKNIMEKLIRKNKNLTYSFLRGPIKYKHKGLIHFITYTDKYDKDYRDIILFEKEHPSVLINLLKQAKTIIGKHPRKFIKKIPKIEIIREDREYFKKKYLILKKKGKITNKKWIKTKQGWELMKTTRHPSEFLRNYLLRYYQKHL